MSADNVVALSASGEPLKRHDGNPGTFPRHMQDVRAELVAINGATPNKNGRSIVEEYTVDIGGAAPVNIPLWAYPAIATIQPTYREAGHANESWNDYDKRLNRWLNETRLTREEQASWMKVDEKAAKVMRAMFSHAGLRACGQDCSTARSLMTRYLEYANAGNLQAAHQAELRIQAQSQMKEDEYFNNYYVRVREYIREFFRCDENEFVFRDQLLNNVAHIKRLAKVVEACRLSDHATSKAVELLTLADAEGRRVGRSTSSRVAMLTGADSDTTSNEVAPPSIMALTSQISVDTCDNCCKQHKGACKEPCRFCLNSNKFQHCAKTHALIDCRHYRKYRGYSHSSNGKRQGQSSNDDRPSQRQRTGGNKGNYGGPSNVSTNSGGGGADTRNASTNP
jgi:hypothetical protein